MRITINKLNKVILVFCISLSMILFATSCAENADITTVQETVPSFDAIHELTENYVTDYSNFMFNSSADTVRIITSEGATPAGNSCKATFIESNDSKYINLVLEVDRENTFDCDEYYRVDASHSFIVRSSIPNDGSPFSINKYVIIDDVLYSIDETNSVLTPVDRPDSLDLYLSFEEIYDLYGGSN